MANAKRASMREGPLAALFRKTEEAGEEAPERPPASVEEQPAREQRHARQRGIPHPALAGEQAESEAAPHVPSPRERLRHAFSSEIPGGVMERPLTPAARRHAQEAPADIADVAGQPVIRVVGVGGGGVNAVNRMVEAEVEGVE